MTRPVFRPKLFETLQGYNRQRFASDLGAGVTVSVVALPLAMAFGIASGLTPQTGLVAAIVGGFLISALGGSRVQIGGPAGAFVVIVYGMVQTLGVQGLMLATLLSGVWLGLMGLLRLGVLIRFIPVAVIIGFTNGIAVLIALSQLRTFTGMRSTLTQSDSGAIVHDLLQHWNQIDLWSLGLNLATLLLLVTWQWGLPRWLPSRWSTKLARVPGPMVALCLVSAWVAFWDWPVQTIGQKFGAMRLDEGLWHWPEWRWAAVEAAFPASLTLALLGAIESLLSAVVADGMTKAGINVKLIGGDYGTFYGKYWCPAEPADPPCSGASDAGIVDYGHRGTPDVYLNAALSTKGVWNSSQYGSATFDTQFGDWAKAVTVDDQKTTAAAIEKTLWEDTPVVIPYTINTLGAFSNKFQGIQTTAMGFTFLEGASQA